MERHDFDTMMVYMIYLNLTYRYVVNIIIRPRFRIIAKKKKTFENTYVRQCSQTFSKYFIQKRINKYFEALVKCVILHQFMFSFY